MSLQLLTPGVLVNSRYEIIEQIGKGGFGAVYEAIDTRLNARVALKHILQQHPMILQAFQREAEFLANLLHPSLPKVMDIFLDNRGQFLAMEFIPGDDLAKQLGQRIQSNQGPFSFDELYTALFSLLDVLEYLHSQRHSIIHRDIKPANIKVTPRGETYLLDFGLAKGAIDEQPKSANVQLTSLFTAFTPHYAAIEQLNGNSTIQSDIYSLGTTFYHLLTGVLPVDARDRIKSAAKGSSDYALRKALTDCGLSQGLADVITRAMSIYASDRFASIAEMRNELLRNIRSDDVIGQKLNNLEALRLRRQLDQERKLRASTEESLSKANRQIASLQDRAQQLENGRLHSDNAWRKARTARNVLATMLVAIIGGSAYIAYSMNERMNETLLRAQRIAQAEQASVLQTAEARAGQRESAIYDSLGVPTFILSTITLTHSPDDGFLSTQNVQTWGNEKINRQNFRLSFTVTTPYPPSAQGWDVVVLFRHTGGNEQYRLALNSTSHWQADLFQGNPSEVPQTRIAQGAVANLNTSENSTNQIVLYVNDATALFFLNGSYAGRFDVSTKNSSGEILFGVEREREGATTVISDISLAGLP